jgi:molybdopterin molybdotransferase
VPAALEALNVEKLFHKVRQRPGKPFWFGVHPAGSLVFAFPGNPVSTFLCLYRYFLLWYFAQSQIALNKIRVFAMLNKEVTFTAPVQYFMQVKLGITETGQLLAIPAEGNGSGDFANLMESDGFMELAAGKTVFKKGEVYPVWAFNKII